jgi:uncharacterized membrane protein YuzA (DUF378 family)
VKVPSKPLLGERVIPAQLAGVLVGLAGVACGTALGQGRRTAQGRAPA